MLRIDPLMLLATLGLIAASVYVVGTATRTTSGRPQLLRLPPGRLRGVGFVLMLLITRFDYSRLREWKLGIYALHDRLDPAGVRGGVLGARVEARDRAPVLQLPAVGAGQAAAGVALSASWSTASRRLTDRETTSRMVLLA